MEKGIEGKKNNNSLQNIQERINRTAIKAIVFQLKVDS